MWQILDEILQKDKSIKSVQVEKGVAFTDDSSTVEQSCFYVSWF